MQNNFTKNKILFVVDRLELKYFEFNKLVTNFWMIRELLKSSNHVFITTIDKLSLENSVAFTSCAESFIENDNIFCKNEFNSVKINDFDMVIFRPDPPVDLDYINATYIFDFVDREKTVILNDTKAIRDFNEKLHANLFLEFMPENIVTSSLEKIEEFLNKHNEIVLKPLNQCFGSGVMSLVKGDKNTRSIINTMTRNGTSICMVQRFLPNIKYGDKRVLTLGDTVLDECVVKLPTSDDFKFNTHSNDYVKKATLSESEKEKFTQIAKKLNSMGISMAGLDVVDEKILEINVTSPCYFINEINNYFSTNLEKPINDFVLSLLKNKILQKQ